MNQIGSLMKLNLLNTYVSVFSLITYEILENRYGPQFHNLTVQTNKFVCNLYYVLFSPLMNFKREKNIASFAHGK